MEHTEKQGCPCCHKTKERSQEEYTKLIHRLNRIEGQIRGIRGMVENFYFMDVYSSVSYSEKMFANVGYRSPPPPLP